MSISDVRCSLNRIPSSHQPRRLPRVADSYENIGHRLPNRRFDATIANSGLSISRATHDGGQVWFVNDNDIIHLLIDGDIQHTHAGDGLPLTSPGKKISEPRAVNRSPDGDLLITESDFGYVRIVPSVSTPVELRPGDADLGEIDLVYVPELGTMDVSTPSGWLETQRDRYRALCSRMESLMRPASLTVKKTVDRPAEYEFNGRRHATHEP